MAGLLPDHPHQTETHTQTHTENILENLEALLLANGLIKSR